MIPFFASANLEGWRQLGELGLAFLLSSGIGLEREIRQKSAGLRTHALVGVGAALFMLISKYGFSDVLQPGRVVVDPSRVAAQIVTGIGFLGAGIIFVRGDSVRGLTTAAAVWVTAGVGSAAGAGLPLLAIAATVAYFVVTLVFPVVTRRVPTPATTLSEVRVTYPDGRGVLRELLGRATARGFTIAEISTTTRSEENLKVVDATLQVQGRGSVAELAAELSALAQVSAASGGDAGAVEE